MLHVQDMIHSFRISYSFKMWSPWHSGLSSLQGIQCFLFKIYIALPKDKSAGKSAGHVKKYLKSVKLVSCAHSFSLPHLGTHWGPVFFVLFRMMTSFSPFQADLSMTFPEEQYQRKICVCCINSVRPTSQSLQEWGDQAELREEGPVPPSSCAKEVPASAGPLSILSLLCYTLPHRGDAFTIQALPRFITS